MNKIFSVLKYAPFIFLCVIANFYLPGRAEAQAPPARKPYLTLSIGPQTQVVGQTLSGTVVAKNGSGFAQNGVTVTISGPGNNTATYVTGQATPFTLNTTSAAGGLNQSITASTTDLLNGEAYDPDSAKENLYKISVKQDGDEVTTTQTVNVGHMINLSADISPAVTAPVSYAWNITSVDYAYKDWVNTRTTGYPVSLTYDDIVSQNPSFVWVNAGSQSASVTVTIGGTINLSGVATANYTVNSPEYTFGITAQGAIAFDDDHAVADPGDKLLHYGTAKVGEPQGIVFSLNLHGLRYGIEQQLIQTVNGTHKRHAPTVWDTRTPGAGLDNGGLDDPKFPFSADSPVEGPYATDSELSINDSFEVCLMYKEFDVVGSAIWVPIQSASWNWSGDVVRHGAAWQPSTTIGTGDLVAGTPATTAAGATSLNYPTWSANIADGVY